MDAPGLLLVSFAPGFFWLWFVVRLDRFRRPSLRIIGLTFAAGMLSTVPAGFINAFTVDNAVFEAGASLSALAVTMLLAVGPVEELSKYLAVRWSGFRSLYLEDTSDGLVLGAAAALGFASVENVGYVLAFGPEVMVLRAPLSSVGHVVFASAWAVGLARSKQGRSNPVLWFGMLAAAAALHGVFNVLATVFLPGAALLVAAGVWLVRAHMRRLAETSPLRLRRNVPVLPCPVCGEPVRSGSHFCPHCGAQLGARRLSSARAAVCSNCGHPNNADARFCTACGDQLVSVDATL